MIFPTAALTAVPLDPANVRPAVAIAVTVALPEVILALNCVPFEKVIVGALVYPLPGLVIVRAATLQL
jgi:hypothetical protein